MGSGAGGEGWTVESHLLTCVRASSWGLRPLAQMLLLRKHPAPLQRSEVPSPLATVPTALPGIQLCGAEVAEGRKAPC